jgi:hypothetical protein
MVTAGSSRGWPDGVLAVPPVACIALESRPKTVDFVNEAPWECFHLGVREVDMTLGGGDWQGATTGK